MSENYADLVKRLCDSTAALVFDERTAAAAAIETLVKERDELQAKLDMDLSHDFMVRMKDERDAAIARVENLEAALNLFAAYSVSKGALDEDEVHVMVCDIRSARAALTKETGE